LSDDGETGHNLVEKYMRCLEEMGWPIMVLFRNQTEEYGVLAKNERNRSMEFVCRGVGKRAFVWRTSGGG
jgi:hypothetical protein